AVDVEVRTDTTRRQARELNEAAVEEHHVVAGSAACARRHFEATLEVRAQNAVLGLGAQIDRDDAAGTGIQLARVSPGELTATGRDADRRHAAAAVPRHVL